MNDEQKLMVERLRAMEFGTCLEAAGMIERLAAGASEGLFKRIPEGWRFYTSDFSFDGSPGRVMLKRDRAGEKWWLSLTDEQQETTSLYQFGRGMTIEKAIDAAIAAIAKENGDE